MTIIFGILSKRGGAIAQGVANHANNKGHRLIAECLFDSIKTAWRLTGLTEIVQEPASIVRTEYFDLSGRRLSDRPTEGIYIVRHIYSDGKRTNRKAIATK